MAFLSVKLIVLDHSCVQPMAKLPSQLLSCMFFLLDVSVIYPIIVLKPT